MPSECADCGREHDLDVSNCTDCGYSPRRVLMVTGAIYFVASLFLSAIVLFVLLMVSDMVPIWLALVVLIGSLIPGLYGCSLVMAGSFAGVEDPLESYSGVFFEF